MQGEALIWLQWMHRNNQLSTWQALTKAIKQRFNLSFSIYTKPLLSFSQIFQPSPPSTTFIPNSILIQNPLPKLPSQVVAITTIHITPITPPSLPNPSPNASALTIQPINEVGETMITSGLEKLKAVVDHVFG